MKRANRLFKAVFALGIVGVLVGASTFSSFASSSDQITISLVGKYDSADTAAIREIDVERKEIRLRNHSTGKNYTLNYDNTSMMYDIYGNVLSPRLLEAGEIVDVTFLKSSKHLTTLNVSKEAWVVENTRKHDLVRNDGTAVINGEVYKIDPRTLVMADGDIALAEDVLSTDSIRASGLGKEIYSVVVQSGHGYVSLSSDIVDNQSLVGAWIELDNEVIHKISTNMLLSAPEGDYTLQILGNGANYQEEVNISRNQETVVDTSHVTIAKPKEGLVTFEIVPDTAEVFVDGTKVLTGVPESVQYGYHNLKIIADGYKTQTKYLKVGTPKSVISIELEKEAEEEEEKKDESETSTSASSEESVPAEASTTSSTVIVQPVSANSASSQNSTEEKTEKVRSQYEVIEGYRIYFDEPYEAELYFDGSYIGMIPTSVVKISGNHEIILKKDGYETKSYRINIDYNEVDLNYQFPQLVKVKGEEESIKKEEEPEMDISGNDAPSEADTSAEASTEDKSKEATTDDTSKEASTSDASDPSSKENTGEEAGTSDTSKKDDSGDSKKKDDKEKGDDSSKDDSAKTANSEKDDAEDSQKDSEENKDDNANKKSTEAEPIKAPEEAALESGEESNSEQKTD
ncbi:PEGA domain-containing protein [Butyrivibrio sp. YAB3001]|uniref:PEGA domain-containing protein n=1 Tax=Butyrivibrio sp. YAB3001 TaxID=1520812 RepID=UPI0008F63D55|nr:PEGA domain-containing protein [Butyrivibrio sp. YAB3001]SFC88755.1 PEGA domain-containing protein [Butyrivibrio sp. YAB3001]